jgi:hypothetical protein
MSTQVRFSDWRADAWRQARPHMVPEWYSANALSNPHTDARAICLDNEPPRRQDRLPQRYASGTPSVSSAVTDVHGVPHLQSTDFIIASTSEGSVKLPVHLQASEFTPTIAALDFLTHTSDTRLQAHPIKYFR